MINIRGSTDNPDPFYRYKMESVSLSSQGVKTAFMNIDSICLSLKRDRNDIIKFLRKYFGSAFEYKNNCLLTTKKDMSKDDLQNAIYKYIEENVLCKKCRNPETEVVKEKKKDIKRCKACSYSFEI
jgi:translation initiation factor 2 beta subunit (eIF-2beta)/eIF-5